MNTTNSAINSVKIVSRNLPKCSIVKLHCYLTSIVPFDEFKYTYVPCDINKLLSNKL